MKRVVRGLATRVIETAALVVLVRLVPGIHLLDLQVAGTTAPLIGALNALMR